jgi:molybdenum cofactor cytidylyltransferase
MNTAALVLAAGLSTRMGRNKLLIDIEGTSLIERVVDTALAARVGAVAVVLGHDVDQVRGRLGNRDVLLVLNPDYAGGLSTSLKAGIAALGTGWDSVLVCLGDMPDIGPDLLNRLIEAYDPARHREIVVPVRHGRRGNPVLWGGHFLPELATLTGDRGAKHLIGQYSDCVVEIECDDDAPLVDLDDQEALAAWRARRLSR